MKGRLHQDSPSFTSILTASLAFATLVCILMDFSSGVFPIRLRTMDKWRSAFLLLPYSKQVAKLCLARSKSPFFQKQFPNEIHASKLYGSSLT